MKKLMLFVCLICILSPIATPAQNDYQIPTGISINDSDLDWLTFNDRNGEAKLGKKELVLKSKQKALYFSSIVSIPTTMTFAKVPLNTDGDFYLSATMKPSKIDDKHLFGLVFNAADEADYNAILFDKQFCYFVRVVNGIIIQGMQDRVRYKYVKMPKDMWKISVERRNGGDYVVSLNGLEIRTLAGNLQLSFPCVGLCVTNKGEVTATEVSFEQWAAPQDQEE